MRDVISSSQFTANVINPAQYNLGRMYQWGKGVEKDLQQARFWFQKAIDNGHEKAKEALTKIKSDLSEKDTEDSFLFP